MSIRQRHDCTAYRVLWDTALCEHEPRESHSHALMKILKVSFSVLGIWLYTKRKR